MAVPRDQSVYPIAVASQLLGLSARTLRLYEQERLIRPARDPRTKQRFYSEQDLVWVRCIQELIHERSLTTVGIRRLLDLIPCWEVKQCPREQAERCRSHLNVPDMAARAAPPAPAASEAEVMEADAGAVEVTLFYGVKQFGVVFPCARCIQAERILRRLAEKYGGRLVVKKHDVLSPEADKAGVMLTPTIVVEGKTVAAGRSLSAEKLEDLLREELEARAESGEQQGNG
jgi:DNA-binding transcriptional MerR regulator